MISLRSEITKKLLNYFFLNPHESLFVNELVRKLDVDKRNLVKKLKELENEGILKSESRGNLKLYSIDKDYPLYNEYNKIILKTVGFENRLKKALEGIKGIEEAYIFGSYAQNSMDTHSDIDLLVVGEHNILSLQKRLNKLQKEIDREINTVNMDRRELKKREKNKDPFIEEIFGNKHIRVIG